LYELGFQWLYSSDTSCHHVSEAIIVQPTLYLSAPGKYWWLTLHHLESLYNHLPGHILLRIRCRISQVAIIIITITPTADSRSKRSTDCEAEPSASLGW
jgi:hypothetical protein